MTGTSITSTVGGDGSFTLAGVPPGSVELHFSGGGIDARGTLTGVGDHDQLTVAVVINGSTAQLTVQTLEAEGTVSGLTGVCPALTFVAGATTVSTDATTTFAGGTCLQLANGGRVDATGVKQPDGSIKATKVSLETPEPPAPGASGPVTELDGVISGLTGVCPAVTFTIGTTKVTTDTTTTFAGGTCLQLANGAKVEATGSTQPDGSFKSMTVKLDDPPPATPPAGTTAEVEGSISGLAGACPAVTFTIGTTKVSTDATTTFSDGACVDLANGGKADVKGLKQLDGSIKATSIEVEDGGGHQSGSADIQGTISGLTGSCPAISFTLGAKKVTTDLTTSFSGGSCQKVTTGRQVDVKGTLQPDGSIKASKVSLED